MNKVKIDIIAKLSGSGAKGKLFKAAEDMRQTHQDLDGIFAGKSGKIKIGIGDSRRGFIG